MLETSWRSHRLALFWRSSELSESAIFCFAVRTEAKLFIIIRKSLFFSRSCVQSPGRIDNIGSKMNFPSGWKEMVTHHPKVPPLFIINFQIPSEFPTSFFSEITDGPGWSLVLYFRMSQVRSPKLPWIVYGRLSPEIFNMVDILNTRCIFYRLQQTAWWNRLLALPVQDCSLIIAQKHQRQTFTTVPPLLPGRPALRRRCDARISMNSVCHHLFHLIMDNLYWFDILEP